MKFILQPWSLMLIILASWVNRQQQEIIEYIRTENATRKAVRAFLDHYHTERNHQGLNNELIEPFDRPPDIKAEIETTELHGGLLRSYRRVA